MTNKAVNMHTIELPKPVAAASPPRSSRPRDEPDTTAMEWTFPDGLPEPPGSDQRFGNTFKGDSSSLCGRRYIDVTMEFPEQYL